MVVRKREHLLPEDSRRTAFPKLLELMPQARPMLVFVLSADASHVIPAGKQPEHLHILATAQARN